MDPTLALANLRAHFARLGNDDDQVLETADIDEMVTDFEGLDEWMSKGGFPPEQWRRPNGRPRLTVEGPVLEGVEHGKRRSYNEGCHCTLCRAANRLRRNLSPAEIEEISRANQ